ncbi:PREDICTED: putative disease resistance protein RGA3 [Nelumbo nucifera]|uniref:Disease resistance protein RGA3 n=1 Tax=Nelumbo nucifera TaxID=4432 RepID=A0A1U8BB85_NELNU|nr:PREDICTED: putative disease resistance protein RGA3 [Nelumbo nucifera]XP_019055274.1 PREDICTED: putative disease resistance protein RGA3 [Nelumbo nucifera]
MFGEKGSKVLVTTRNEKVSLVMGTLPVHRLQVLENEYCWSIFKQRAFVDDTVVLGTYPHLEEIGRKIVEKCKGVPLAVKSLGGLLHSKVEKGYWEFVLTSEIWELENDENGIMPALRLSYHHLPAHLKKCFSYCSIFPKDYFFEKEELILLWIGEGFIPPRGNRQMDISRDYFDELYLRSFFQKSERLNRSGEPMFVMHDLIHDLAQSILKDVYLRMEQHDNDKLWNNIGTKARYLSLFLNRDHNTAERLDALYQVRAPRTFLLRGPSFYRVEIPCLVTNLDRLFDAWRCLRVLCLRNLYFGNNDLSDMIGNLKLLRYLDLSYTGIRKLPISISSLYQLEILLLEGLELELPVNIGSSLVNIRLVKILSYKCRIPQENRRRYGVGDLKLWGCIMGCNSITISGLDNVVVSNADVSQYINNFKNNQQLETLTLEWETTRDRDVAKAIMECLQPAPTNLRILKIKGYYGERLPRWMAEMSNLEKLELDHCRSKVLPPLGKLPSLKHLIISSLDNWEGEWSLEEDMDNGEVSSTSEQLFLKLVNLQISNCPKLKGLPPCDFPDLRTLRISDCEELRTSINPERISTLETNDIFRCPNLR